MKLAEDIFLSIQWEWPNTGKPSIFVRFFGCNLCCKWCDSLYAVNQPDGILELSVAEVCEKIKKLKCTNIVFTGWETTLFYKDIQEIQDTLGWDNYTWEIETNGSFPIRNKFHNINISPKLSNSWNKPYELKALNELPLYAVYPIQICFKFVAKTKEDFKEIDDYIEKYDIFPHRVYIMPEWTTLESQINKEVLDYCIKKWYRYCLRQHIILFGNKKWV